MKTPTILLLLTLVGLTGPGCGPSQAPSESPSVAPEPAAETAAPAPPPLPTLAPPPAPPPGGAAAAQKEAERGPDWRVVEQMSPEDTKSAEKIIEFLNGVMASFFTEYERPPKTLQELVQRGYLRALPAPPAGMNFNYDPRTSTVTVVKQ